MASQVRREIMNSEVVGSILTVIHIKRKRKKAVSHVQEPENTFTQKTPKRNDESNAMRSLRADSDTEMSTKGTVGYSESNRGS